MKIGFAGLGQMGKPMAMNLNKAGIELIVYDVRTESYPAFSAKGIATAASLNDLADCEIVFLSLPDTHIVEKVLLGQGVHRRAGAARGSQHRDRVRLAQPFFLESIAGAR